MKRVEIHASTQSVGVIGYPVKHTLSPPMHNAAFRALGLDWLYLAFEVHPDRLEQAIAGMRGLGLRGLNVTIPHKGAVMPYLDRLTDAARQIGAVNTLFWERDRLIGDNTDAIGFLNALQSAGFDPKGAMALVVGAGGSARAVLYALRQQGAALFLTNRSLEKAQALADEFGVRGVYPVTMDALRPHMKQFDLVVQCTPLGMIPHPETEPPLPLEELPAHAWVNDLVYRPLQTRLLQRAESLGLHTVNGLEMLLYQGAAAFTRWTQQHAPIEVMRETLIQVVR